MMGLPWRSSGLGSKFKCMGCGFSPWSGCQDATQPSARKPETQKRSNVVTNSIKTLKKVQVKKILRKKTRKKEDKRPSEEIYRST